MRSFFSLFFFLIILQSGCHRHAAELTTIERFPLVFDGPLGAPPRAFVGVSANGHLNRWLVDTAATNNLVGWWYTKSIAVATAPVPNRGDGVIGVASPLAVKLGGVARRTDHFSVVNMLPELEQREVAGILSPQLLAMPGTTLLINFKQSAMSLIRGPLDPHHDDGPGWSLAPGGMKLCHPTDDSGARYLVPAEIGGVEGWLQVASGSAQSRLFADSPAAEKVTVENHIARAIDMKVGDGHVRANLMVVPRPLVTATGGTCGEMGMLGMDVLKSCVLLLDGSNALGRCWN